MSSYGLPITIEGAKKAAAAALAEARANNWAMAVAIVDTAGHLVYFEKMDDTQLGSVVVAQAKARAASLFKRPTKAFQDTLAAGARDGVCSASRARLRWRAAFRSRLAARLSERSAFPAARAPRMASAPAPV